MIAQFGQGDLSVRVNTERQDEIGQLGVLVQPDGGTAGAADCERAKAAWRYIARTALGYISASVKRSYADL